MKPGEAEGRRLIFAVSKVSEVAAFHGWKPKFGGMEVVEAQRWKGLEDESRRHQFLVAVLSLHGEALKGVI